MGYGYSNGSTYYKTRNLEPSVAAIYRANQARKTYEEYTPKTTVLEQEEEFFEWWNYDHINGEWFPNFGSIPERHPEVRMFIRSNTSFSLNVNSKVVINLKCPNNHKWKQVAKEFIAQHRTATTEGKLTCSECELAAAEARRREEELLLLERKARAKANRTPLTSISENAERYFYIHQIDNINGETVAYKYGIAVNVYARRMQQQKSIIDGFTLTTVHVTQSTSKEVSLIERRVKQHLRAKRIKPAFTKEELNDGWTETVQANTVTLEMLLDIVSSL